jgi:CDP-diacylglycerol--glycerol-3-phosphate 3-phosphatidyltransferase
MQIAPIVNAVPLLLTLLRAGLAPVMVLLALVYPSPAAFAACLIVAVLSDYFDGVIARLLKIATPNLRRLDSIADSLFYLGALFAAWWLYPHALTERLGPLAILIGLEILRYVVDYAKFRREASYHMWSAKLFGVALFLGFFALLVLGSDGLPVSLAIYLGIVSDIEGLAISLVLREWRSDVPTVFHALRLRRIAES